MNKSQEHAPSELNILSMASSLSITPDQVRLLIYELSGERKIDGEFIDDDTFKISPSSDEFGASLDEQFADWAIKEKSKLGKKI